MIRVQCDRCRTEACAGVLGTSGGMPKSDLWVGEEGTPGGLLGGGDVS